MTDCDEVSTVHGTVDYEVVECVSCGNQVVAERAETVVVGELKGRSTSPYASREKFIFDSLSVEHGHVCEYCRDDPAAYPSGTVVDILTVGKVLYVATALLTSTILIAGLVL